MSILTNTPTPGQICYGSWVKSEPKLNNLWDQKTQEDKAAREAAAAAVLASQWRPVSEGPKNWEDWVIVGYPDASTLRRQFINRGCAVVWMPIPPLPTPPEPTPEERERAEFEAHPEFCKWDRRRGPINGEYDMLQTQMAWLGWQAARKPKEESK